MCKFTCIINVKNCLFNITMKSQRFAHRIVEPSAVFGEGLSLAVSLVEIVLRTDRNIVASPRLGLT